MAIKSGITSLDMNVLLDELGEGKRKPQEVETSWGSYREKAQQKVSDSVAVKAGVREDTLSRIKAVNEKDEEKDFWKDFGNFFAKENSTTTANQTNKFSLGTNSKTAEENKQDYYKNTGLRFGVDEDLLDRMAAEAEEKKGKDIFTEAMESSVANTAANITGTADFLVGQPLESLGWEDNFISEWNSYYQDKAEEKHRDVMKAAARTEKGKTAEITGEILTFLGEAGIDAALSVLTGGALAAAKLGSKGGKVLKYADDVGDLLKENKKISKNNFLDKIDYSKKIKYTNVVDYYNYKKRNPNANYSDYKKAKSLDTFGIKGIKNIPPKKINVKELKFRDSHAGRHGCTEEDAKQYIKNAKCSITRKRWDGISENFYSDEGAAYVDIKSSLIKTSFSKKDFDEETKVLLEVLK